MTEIVAEGASPDNPDRAFLQQVLEAQSRNVTLAMNPALASLKAVLLKGIQGTLSVRFTAPSNSIQGNGVVSGGTLTSMLDFAMALAALSKLPPGRSCATISLTINMLEPGNTGDFVAEARVNRLGGRVAFLSSDLYDATGARCIANATASFAVFDVRS